MSDFVCAVRGGPGSYETRLAALERAQRTSSTAHFISVVDPRAYEPLHEGEQHAIRSELAWRDLAISRATATRAKLTDVSYSVEVRVGELVETIAAYAREREADAILIGQPRSAADAVIGSGVDAFAAALREAAGVEVFTGARTGADAPPL